MSRWSMDQYAIILRNKMIYIAITCFSVWHCLHNYFAPYFPVDLFEGLPMPCSVSQCQYGCTSSYAKVIFTTILHFL